jgi:hypothetical protein
LTRLARWLRPSASCNSPYKLREAIASLGGEKLAEVKRQSLEALRAYYLDGGMSFPAEVLIVSGSKSSSA